jgi:hypothetical protein
LWPQIDDPLLLNQYVYAYNNPLKFADVDGLTAAEVAEYFADADFWNGLNDLPLDAKTAAEKAQVQAGIREFLNKEVPGLVAKKEAALKAAAEEAARAERIRIAQALRGLEKIGEASVGLGKQAMKVGWNLLKQVPDPLLAIDLLIRGDLWTLEQWRYIAREKAARQAELERRKAEYEQWKAKQEMLRLADLAKREAEFKQWKIEQQEQARVNALLREGKGGVMLGGVPPEHIGKNESVIAKHPR